MPPVILKFVQFHVKDEVYKLRRLLRADFNNNRYLANLLNGKLIYIIERLPPIETMVNFAAEDMSFVTSTCVQCLFFVLIPATRIASKKSLYL